MIYDITVPVRSGMVVFEGDPPVHLERVHAMDGGATANVSRLDAGVHTGTHIDAPVHFIPGGSGVDETPLDALIGQAVVVDATDVPGHIDAGALAGLRVPEGAERVIFKTRNSGLWEQESLSREFAGLTHDAAAELARRAVRLVGIDYLSVAPFGDPAPTHRTLLDAGVVILEGLDLRGVPPGDYTLVCLPLLLEGADGAPARAVLTSG